MKHLYLYNSLTRKKERFEPITPGAVRIYSCGPTIYDFPHIGNYRSFLFSDLLHRVLKVLGYSVDLVMNLTDIDDKTIRTSQEESLPLRDFTTKYGEAFFADLKALNILPAREYPRATDHILEMIDMIGKLLDKGHAYEVGGSVYFKLESFSDYGKLSNLNREEQIAGAGNRVASDEYERDEISDFVLWKAYQESDGEVFYDSPWGKGRPGWHIECSAMSKKYLGDHFDIHTGGIDNKFPHHENEIAQSVCANDHSFVNYWLHVSHLLVENKKMSKSLSNFYTLRDLLDKGISNRVIRYMLISSHYRNQYNFTFQNFEATAKAIERMDWFYQNLSRQRKKMVGGSDHAVKEDDPTLSTIHSKRKEFLDYICDDLNISGALGVAFELVSALNPLLERSDPISKNALDAADDFFQMVNKVVGVFSFAEEEKGESKIPAPLLQLLKERATARQNKDFSLSDTLRDQIQEHGYKVLDKPGAPLGQEIYPL